MTLAFERTRALVETKRFLESLLDPKQTPRVPLAHWGRAKALLRHFPTLPDLEAVHLAVPATFGPVFPLATSQAFGDLSPHSVELGGAVTDMNADTAGRRDKQ